MCCFRYEERKQKCKAKELDRFSYNANKSPYKRFACRGVIIRFCRKMTVWVNSERCS